MANERRIRDIARRHERREALKEPYDVILIVCEGLKTEPLYFEALRIALRLGNANVRVTPSSYGNDPMSVVRYGEEQCEREAGFDKVFCVFDKNGHANYDDAVRRVVNSVHAKAKRFFAITSVPCFELWLLLHYVYHSAGFRPRGALSSCGACISTLQKHLPEYEKGLKNVYSQVHSKTEDALERAARLTAENKRTGSQNPSTQVHHLVRILQKLRKQKADA